MKRLRINYARIDRFRTMLIKKIKTYLKHHHNEIEVLVQGDISLDGTLKDNDDEYIAYVYTSIKIVDGDLMAEGYSHFIGDDLQTQCRVNSDALSINELLDIIKSIIQ